MIELGMEKVGCQAHPLRHFPSVLPSNSKSPDFRGYCVFLTPKTKVSNMAKTPSVPANVPANVPTNVPIVQEGRTPRGANRKTAASYLTGGPAGWRFQIRIPADLISDSFLASPRRTIRARIGAGSRKLAELRAGLCATLCQAIFALARQVRENVRTAVQN